MLDEKNINGEARDKSNDFKMRKAKKIIVFVLLLTITAFAIGYFHDHFKSKKEPSIPARPVKMAQSSTADVPVYIDSFGTLSPLNNVDVKAQVTGEIMSVHFKEGDDITKGKLLFVIDPSTYQAQLKKAEALLAADQADLKLKQDTLERNEKLFKKGLISKQELEKYQTDVTAAQATVMLDEADIRIAKINLDYCFIASPIDGVAGKRQVDAGNIVAANSGPTLVNIKTIDSLYLDFTINERQLAEVRDAMSKSRLKVEISPEDDGEAYEGEVVFIDNKVDDATGTVAMRAIVSNKERKLWSGEFVQVRLILRTEEGAVVVPYQAVQLGQKGYYIFVFKSDNTADLRDVTPGIRYKDSIVIEKGIKAGEKVVTEGQMGLASGVPVVDITQQKKEDKKETGKKETNKK